ncbi:CDP-alcohol phosphatidyltransferase [Deinococcus geothermalis DSM 11300]|uniref:CDP-alcohol phosphatidyltransferase n=1 Tax=Deinococcus geothermalis (strain DSM 11300 / CIP 105573 / AG-3a) TaxID=319795 RepID=Q1IW31_DEIGD|nr:CDP-alcohol phosphatidyltransferase family protein [Deinococcus geothermalis]ABF46553.1 CDP-alcohol phosphatidyltransferase [Deinococcus geothermalis DSM 11300]
MTHGKARPAREWAAESLFRPLAEQLLPPLARRRVNPVRVVLTHTALGVLAGALLRRGHHRTPAALLQVKTLLDNLDGQLARATGQTTETGRYLDSEMDVVVNAAVLVGLAGRWGLPLTLLQSLILSVDYLWERDHRAARGEVFRDPPAQTRDDPRILAALRLAYTLYFTPQERLLEALFERRLRAVTGGTPTSADRRAYTPRAINQVAVNLGLSTQLLALGGCLLLRRPRIYLWSLPAQALLLAGVQVWREGRVVRGRLEKGRR